MGFNVKKISTKENYILVELSSFLIHNAHLIDSEIDYKSGWIHIENGIIKDLSEGAFPFSDNNFDEIIDAHGKLVMPGVIDEHVHFREPGLTDKADIFSESCAAAAGGVTTFFDMPNTFPATTTLESWQEKMEIAEEKSIINYAFYIGAQLSNLKFLKKADYSHIPGIKLFLGATTGTNASDDDLFLEELFRETEPIIAIHAEDETEIKLCRKRIIEETCSEDPPIERHPDIRSESACVVGTKKIINLARKFNHRAHIMHLSTSSECALLEDGPLNKKLITSETCPQYLIFAREDYGRLGTRIKCNPAIKEEKDRAALIKCVFGSDNRIDVVSTDHAPHLLANKTGGAIKAVSGMPGVQFSLLLMLSLAKSNGSSTSAVSRLMSGNPAEIWKLEKRGFLRKGYYADLTMLEESSPYRLSDNDVISKCKWTPYLNIDLYHRVIYTWVNGIKVFDASNGIIGKGGMAVSFHHNFTVKSDRSSKTIE